MPITVEDCGGLLCPAIVCDWCQERIEDAADGNVYYYHDDEGLGPPPANLFYNHKRCAWAHDADLEVHKREGTLVMSEDLGVFLAQLLGNTGRNGAMLLIDRRRLYETRGRDA